MARAFNQVIVKGVLGADPEVRSFNNGGKVANLRVAVDDSYKGKDGNWVDRTEWVPVAVMSDGLVTLVERALKKGSHVMVIGQFKTRQWEKDGEKRYTTEVVVSGFNGQIVTLDQKPKDAGGSSDSGRGQASSRGGYDLGDDDLPF